MCGCMLQIVAGLSTHADIRDVQADVGLLHVLMSGKVVSHLSGRNKNTRKVENPDCLSR